MLPSITGYWKTIKSLLLFAVFVLAIACKSQPKTLMLEKASVEPLQQVGEVPNTPQIKYFKNPKAYHQWLQSIGFSDESLQTFPPQTGMIVFFAGMRRSGGFTVEISNCVQQNKKINIQINETRPGNNCAVTNMITYPFAAVFIPELAQEKQLFYKLKQQNIDCR